MLDQHRLNDDDRFELASRAAMASRASRPVLPLVVGTLALLAGLSALLWTSMARSKAMDRLGSERRKLDLVVSYEQKFAAIETRKREGASGVQEPLPDLLSRLEKAATDSGLNKPAIPKDTSNSQLGVNDHRLTYTLRGEPLESVLAWIDLATKRIPGLEVHDLRLSISPSGRSDDDQSTWMVTVTFARWETTS